MSSSSDRVLPLLKVHTLHAQAKVPRYETSGAAGLDLSAALDAPMTIAPGQYAKVPTGLVIAVPHGYEGQVRPRSGLAAKHGVTLLNSPGTIDEDYRGQVQVLLINHGPSDFTVQSGDRIAQLIIAPVAQVPVVAVTNAEELGKTTRGQGGFGSTGR